MTSHAMPDPRRRGLLGLALAAGIAPSQVACTQLREWPSDPFAFGIASGCPRAESVVLWTRLAPAAAPRASEPVGWELAADEAFRDIVRRGTESAVAADGHSVHAEAAGLEPS